MLNIFIVCNMYRYHQSPYDPDTRAGTALTPPTHPYRSVGCVFNHETFYANAQLSDSVLTCDFNINNKSLWKRLSTEDVSTLQQVISSLLFPPPSSMHSLFGLQLFFPCKVIFFLLLCHFSFFFFIAVVCSSNSGQYC